MYMKLPNGKSKVLTLSYDDGVYPDIRLIGLMEKCGVKGTFNINTGMYLDERTERAAPEGRLKLSETSKLYSSKNCEVAVHALTHPFLEKLKDEEIIYEIVEDRRNIEAQYGTLAVGMAYPYGTYDDRVVDILDKCGICYSRTTVTTEKFDFPKNWLTLHPTCHHNNPRLMEMAKKFVEEKSTYPSDNWLFYLWGHSYEFDRNNNWNVIEEFLEYTGGKEDIWYATNIEIYDYVKAYETLRIGADRKMVYNPSALDVWFLENNKIYCVKSRETLEIN